MPLSARLRLRLADQFPRAAAGHLLRALAAVIVVHPNNPTGHFTKAAEMEKLNRICAQYNLAIIADEVFLDFALQGDEPRHSASRKMPPVLTFTMSGLSKISGLPQMKAAWLITSGPKQLEVTSSGTPGNHRGHLSFDECARAAGDPRAARTAPSVSATR